MAVLRLVISLLLFTVTAAADVRLEKNSSAPDVPPAIKEQVQGQGIRVLNDSGDPYAEIWLAKALNAVAKAPGSDVLYSGIPEGSFLGVWRFVHKGSDFRGTSIKPGLYTMRYELMPADGNHMGASQYRDFVLLLPVAADENPSEALKFEQAVALSRKASGTGHPAVNSRSFICGCPSGEGWAAYSMPWWRR